MTYEMPNKYKNWRQRRGFGSNQIIQGFAYVEKIFWYYKKIKQEVNEIRSERGYYQSGHKEGGGSSNHAFISDPTYQLAIKQVEPVKRIVFGAGKFDEEVILRPEDWLRVVDETLVHFKNEPEVLEILQRRFFRNQSMPMTCCEMEISNDKYYALRNKGIGFARECAIQLGLIKVF